MKRTTAASEDEFNLSEVTFYSIFGQDRRSAMNRLLFGGLVAVFLCQNLSGVDALNNGLALTPPMGWMSWQRYRCIIDCDTYPDECIR